jgi:hypothetical protein
MHARSRWLWVSLAPVFAGSAAYAQAPGEVVVVVPPTAAPQLDAPPAVVVSGPAGPVAPAAACSCGADQAEAPRASVMANRWAIGLSLGSMSLGQEGAPDDKTGFAVGELALRFRATRRFELAAALGGGRQQRDGRDGELEIRSAELAVRYRFNPEGAWNWFATAGIGGASVARRDATQIERDDATRSLVTFGLGIERRFHQLALQAEARLVALGDLRPTDPVMTETTATSTSTTAVPSHHYGGGALSLGVSYYF